MMTPWVSGSLKTRSSASIEVDNVKHIPDGVYVSGLAYLHRRRVALEGLTNPPVCGEIHASETSLNSRAGGPV